jgi:hypothetical protein
MIPIAVTDLAIAARLLPIAHLSVPMSPTPAAIAAPHVSASPRPRRRRERCVRADFLCVEADFAAAPPERNRPPPAARLALSLYSLENHPMPGRGSRGKPRAVRPVRVAPPEEATVRMETSPELLESLRDESERPTIRLPVRAPLAPIEEPEIIPVPEEIPAAAPVLRRRVVYGPDGVPRTLYDDELEEATRPYVPPKVLLGRGSKARKKR